MNMFDPYPPAASHPPDNVPSSLQDLLSLHDARFVRAAYLAYLTVVGSTLGLALHRDADTYRYIPESIRRYPGAGPVAAMIGERGFSESGTISVLGGLMAIHRARRTRPPSA